MLAYYTLIMKLADYTLCSATGVLNSANKPRSLSFRVFAQLTLLACRSLCTVPRPPPKREPSAKELSLTMLCQIDLRFFFVSSRPAALMFLQPSFQNVNILFILLTFFGNLSSLLHSIRENPYFVLLILFAQVRITIFSIL